MITLHTPGAVAGLEARLARLTPETPAAWGRMNAHQMVCHLNDAFVSMMGLRPVSEDITFVNRTLVRWIALHTPMPWPRGVPTRPECDAFTGGTRPSEFARDAARLLDSLRRFAGPQRDFAFARHPIFGPLTEKEWMHWGYRHADHHFRQFRL